MQRRWLKLCEVIVGPVSSNYAKTAAGESLLTRGYLSQHGMCKGEVAKGTAAGGIPGGLPPHLAKKYGGGHAMRFANVRPSLAPFEAGRGVEGMFAECKPVAA